MWFHEVSQWLPNGKFLGLLTIMFGIGLEIQRQSAIRAGRRWPGGYPIRAGLLFLDGVINYIFVVNFDVLRAYAVVGVLVAFLLLLNERVQWWLLGLFVSVHTAIMVISTVMESQQMTDQSAAAATGDGPNADMSAMGAFPEANSSYLDSVRENLKGFVFDLLPGSEFFTILTLGLGLFLLGAKLYRIGIFEQSKRKLRYWLMGVGFGVALPLDFAFGTLLSGQVDLGPLARYGTSAIVALGILALVAEFYLRRPTLGTAGKLLATVGQMALSCYLLQNIVGVILQYTLFTSPLLSGVNRTLLTYLMFGFVTVFMIVFSTLWLRKFSRGPFEIVWNWSYRKLARQ